MSKYVYSFITSLVLCLQPVLPGLAIQSPVESKPTSANQASTPASNGDADKSSVDALWNQIDSDTSKAGDKAVENKISPDAAAATSSEDSNKKIADKPLQGYIRIVPVGTKIPIIMDAAVDSDTSQEGDEFAARTGEDLVIDGRTIVPAGSVIKGRIAGINAPKNLSRSGTVALKFDTITTPDNRQIPLVATLVARGGVIHARRGMKDIAFTVGTVAVPTVVGLGIGAIAGAVAKSSKIGGTGGGALIGAGIGVAIGVIILCAKKGQKVDVRPGDELKIELAEDLHMPM